MLLYPLARIVVVSVKMPHLVVISFSGIPHFRKFVTNADAKTDAKTDAKIDVGKKSVVEVLQLNIGLYCNQVSIPYNFLSVIYKYL